MGSTGRCSRHYRWSGMPLEMQSGQSAAAGASGGCRWHQGRSGCTCGTGGSRGGLGWGLRDRRGLGRGSRATCGTDKGRGALEVHLRHR